MKTTMIETVLLRLLFAAAVLWAAAACASGAEREFNPDRIPDVQTPAIYTDPSQPIDKRVDDLVSRMTLREKVGQMMNSAQPIDRLGVAKYDWWNECLHGVAFAGTATVYPQAIGMAATWDTELIHNAADTISTEARAKHHEAVRRGERSIFKGLTFWSPNINLFRDPRWGRGQETYGEDPFLTGRLAIAFVKGLQGDDPKYLKVVSTPKHFAVHSGPEPERHRFDAVAPERDFRESYLPHFEAAVREGGAYSVMGAYNRTYGEPCCASNLLLEKILRKEWGFKGYVVSDCGAINDIFAGHRVVDSPHEAAAMAVKAGCDIECGGVYQHLVEAAGGGIISEGEIDVAVKRLMEARFRLGMFDPPEKVAYTQIPISKNDCPEHRALALRTSRESIVLLKNEGILPLKKDIKRIAVIGPNADSIPVLLGNYNGYPSAPVTVLQGIKDKAGPDRTVTYVRGCGLVERDVFTPIPETNIRYKGRAGLRGEYFDNMNLSGTPKLTRQDSRVDFNWGERSPAPGIPREQFSARWTGELAPPADGEYTLAVRGDDGFRLKLNGEVVIEEWNEHPPMTKTYKVKLEANQPVPIVLEFYQNRGGAEVALLWDANADKMLDATLDIVRNSDVVIFVGGISPQLEGEEMNVHYDGFSGGDRTKIEAPSVQTELLKALSGTGKPVVMVNCSGSAVALPWEAENLPAILQAWYPGQAGGTAVADVLLGDYNPAGRLPVTFYRSTDDLPPFRDYAMANRTYRYFTGKPLWPFGYGLSYTSFKYANLKLSKSEAGKTDTVAVSCDVTNTGDVDGDEVVQLYVSETTSPEPRPIQSLRGFARVNVKKGATARVEIPLRVADLRYWDVTAKQYTVYPGSYEIRIGASSSDIRLKGKLTVR